MGGAKFIHLATPPNKIRLTPQKVMVQLSPKFDHVRRAPHVALCIVAVSHTTVPMAPKSKPANIWKRSNLSVQDKVLARTLLEEGHSMSEVARVLKCKERTLYRHKKRWANLPPWGGSWEETCA